MELHKKFILDRNNTQQLKGFAILLVLLGHTGLINFAGAYGVSIFLLISGFGLAQSYLKSGLTSFFEKRINKVILPYFIITLIWLLINITFHNQFYILKDIILTLLGLKLQSQIDQSMWYISFLLMWYFTFFIIFSLPLNNLLKVIIIIYITPIFFEQFQPIFAPESGMQLYLIEFPIGVFIGIYFKEISILVKKFTLIILDCLCIISLLFFVIFHQKSSIDIEYTKYAVLFAGITSILLFSIIHMLDIKVFNMINKCFEKLGTLSYEIYLIEFIILTKYYNIFYFISNKWIKFTVLLSFLIILGYMLNKIVFIFRKIISKSILRFRTSLNFNIKGIKK